MRGLQTHRDAEGSYQLDETICHLLAEALLHREPAREEPDEPCELRDTEDLAVRDVRDVRDSVKRQRVVLAEREERDRSLDDLAAAAVDSGRALGWECRAELRVAVVSGGRVDHRLEESARGVARTGRMEIHAERAEDLGDMALVALEVVRREDAVSHMPRRDGMPVEVDHVGLDSERVLVHVRE